MNLGLEYYCMSRTEFIRKNISKAVCCYGQFSLKKSAKRMVILLKVESLGILGGREFDFAWKTWVRSLFYFQIYDWILAKQVFFVEIWKGFYFEVSVLFKEKPEFNHEIFCIFSIQNCSLCKRGRLMLSITEKMPKKS